MIGISYVFFYCVRRFQSRLKEGDLELASDKTFSLGRGILTIITPLRRRLFGYALINFDLHALCDCLVNPISGCQGSRVCDVCVTPAGCIRNMAKQDAFHGVSIAQLTSNACKSMSERKERVVFYACYFRCAMKEFYIA